MFIFHAMRGQINPGALLLSVFLKDEMPKTRWTGLMAPFSMDVKFVCRMPSMEGHKATTGSDRVAEIEDIMIAVEDEGRTLLVVEDQGLDRTRRKKDLDHHETENQDPAHHAIVHLAHPSKNAVGAPDLLHRKEPANHQREMVLQQEIESRLRLTSPLSVTSNSA